MICKGLSNECCVCAYANSCLSGHTRNTFEPASKSEIIKRIGENKFSEDRKDMIDYLKRRYGVNYISCIEGKEKENNPMLHKVTITKSEEKTLEEYWCMRAIKENPETKSKSVVKESECTKEPTLEEIALFLANSGGDFVSVEHNYRFADLPF